ncbi:MAG: cysteine desulfurase, partial [Anaerolineae bacterium]|nr:cysteine desulfurase [Anaerolineae bacterium]
LTTEFGNASSRFHAYGMRARNLVDTAREQVAALIGAMPSEIIFTSGATESNNLALRGAAAAHAAARGLVDGGNQSSPGHIITATTEHKAVLDVVKAMRDEGWDVTFLSVDREGRLDLDRLRAAIRPDTALISLMAANNEIGTLHPVEEIGAIARQHGVTFHCDAVQAAGNVAIDVERWNVDLLSLSSHKLYGPKGVGALYVREGIDLLPSQSGGIHEDGRRAGTLNTPGIVGMAKALELAYDEHEARVAHYQTLRDALIDGVLARVPGAHLTGHRTQRLPGHASFILDGVEANMLLVHLDLKGIAGSSGSACKTGNPEPSGLLMAMGYTPEQALTGLRLTVGMQTTEADIEYTIDAIAESVEKVRALA